MVVDDGIGVLDEAECLELLSRSSIGRVAVTIGAVPAVFPVNFRLVDRSIVFRTGTGTKLDAAVRHAVVAFEVTRWTGCTTRGGACSWSEWPTS